MFTTRGGAADDPHLRRGAARRGAQVGGLTAGQFAIFDSMLPVMGLEKFHYVDPAAGH